MATIIKFLELILNWLKRSFAKPKTPSNGVPNKYTHIAIIVGHDNKSVGAKSYSGEFERWWNEKVAKAIVKMVKTKKVKVFYRDGVGRKGAAKAAAKWAGDDSLSIELHFNAFKDLAFGTETLYLKGDYQSEALASKFSKAISLRFRTRIRHDNGAKMVHPNDRGGMNLKYCKDYGIESSVLLEPFFGNKRTSESERFMEGDGWLNYAECLALFIESI